MLLMNRPDPRLNIGAAFTAQDARWITAHMDMSEELNLSWPPPAPRSLEGNSWFSTASQRQQEIICFAQAADPSCLWVDSSQSVNRARNSNHKESPTVMPGSHLWSFDQMRFMTGRDLLRLQGFPIESLSGAASLSDNQQADLAGNGFAMTVSCAVDVAVLLSIQCATDSNIENEMNVSQILHSMCGSLEPSQENNDDEFEI